MNISKLTKCWGRWAGPLWSGILALPLAACSATLAAHAKGPLDEATELEPFVAEMRTLGYEEDEVRKILGEAKLLPHVIEAISRPAEAKPWHAYRPIFLTETRISKGLEFWNSQDKTLARAEETYGVPAEIIVAIIGVETLYGERAGRIRVLDSLVTLGFRYPRRSEFFRKELKNFLLLTREEGLDPLTLKGSYAGAMGVPQFISSSYRNYAVDFDGDGKRDLIANPTDAIGSVANYLKRHGWRRDGGIAVPAKVDGDAYRQALEMGHKPKLSADELSRKGVTIDAELKADSLLALIELDLKKGQEHWAVLPNFYVITRYNHSKLYAMAVTQLAWEIRKRRLNGAQ